MDCFPFFSVKPYVFIDFREKGQGRENVFLLNLGREEGKEREEKH